MKRVRLNDLESIQRVIDEAEGMARKRWLSAEEVVEYVANWHRRSCDIPKSALVGCKMKIQACADTVAKCYRGTPYETVAYLSHDTQGWYVECVRRESMKGHSWNVEVELTDYAKQWILQSIARM